MTNQAKFDQTKLLYIINGEVNKFIIGKQMSGQFSTLIISSGGVTYRDLYYEPTTVVHDTLH